MCSLPNGRMLLFAVEENWEGNSVENFLLANGISRRALIKLKQIPNAIQKNGVHARSVDILHAGDQVSLYLAPHTSRLRPSHIPVPILYEDADILVFDKPANMPCHPSGMHINDTLANVWAAYCVNNGGPVSPFRALNRLDKDTSGVVIAAKHQIAAAMAERRDTKGIFCAGRGGNFPRQAALSTCPLSANAPLN